MNPEDLINSAKEETTNPENSEDLAKEVDRKREELLLLASDGEIKKSEVYIKKANAKTILKMYAEYEAEVREKTTVFLCDMFLAKFAMMMGGLDAVEKPEEMEKELKRDPYLNKDLKSIMSKLTPMIPFLGLLSGGLMPVGKHMYSHTKSNKQEDKQDKQKEGEDV